MMTIADNGGLMAEDEPVSQYEDSRDAAESPSGYIGSMPGDNGRGAEDALDPDYICIGPGDSARVLVDDELVGNWEGYDGRDDSEY